MNHAIGDSEIVIKQMENINMPWVLVKDPKYWPSLPKLPKLPRLPRLPRIPKIPQIRPIKPIAPVGYKYVWREPK